MLIGCESMLDSACNPELHKLGPLDSQRGSRWRREIVWQVVDDSRSAEHEYPHRPVKNQCLRKGNRGSNHQAPQIGPRRTESRQRGLVVPRQGFGSSFYRGSDFLFCLGQVYELS